MRLIVINDHGAIVGGASQVAISSLNELANNGIDVTFVSSIPPVDACINHDKVRVLNFGGYDLINNPSKIDAALHGIWDNQHSKKISNLLDEYSPKETIIHLHTWTKSLTSSVAHQAMIKGFKLVITLHDYFSICPNGGLYNYKKGAHCEMSPMSTSCFLSNCDSRSYIHKLWRFSRHFAQNHVAKLPNGLDYFISISSYSESLLRPHLPLSAKFYRVPNPIEVYEPVASTPSSNQSFCFIGRLSPEKGGKLFAGAAKAANVPAVFIGSGIERESILHEYPESQMRGWQNRFNVNSGIASSRALVFPSLWHETQGLVVLEAAALGVPSIVSDGCAARDYVTHGETGLVFKSGSTDDLVRCLKLLQADPMLADTMGREAFRRYWANPSSLDTHVKDLLNCYVEIMKDAKI